MKILKTFEIVVDLNLDGEQIREATKLINLFYTGDSEVNIFKNGRFVPKYPEIEKSNPNFKDSHYALHRTYRKRIKVNLMENGTLEIANNEISINRIN